MRDKIGSPSGKAESGTEEEFNCAMESHKATGFPEIKWFFRKVDNWVMPTDPEKIMEAAAQWQKVLAFRRRMSAEVGLREKTDILRPVAAHMQAGPGGLKGNLIDGSSLTGLIEDYLQSELSFAQSRAAVRAVVEYLRQRNFILCFAGSDSYAFVHRTFLEHTRAARPAGPRESKP